MGCKIKSVKAMEKFILLVEFQNGIQKTCDIQELFIIFPQFKVFETNTILFSSVKVDIGGYGISWNDELDLAAEDIWDRGKYVQKVDMDILDMIAAELVKSREQVGMTQKQLSTATGIYQADISKIERGLANPSISTLKRLANGMGMKLKMEFEKC